MDWKNLEKAREEAEQDKAELFDFYHSNWERLVAYTKKLEAELRGISCD